ncbi:MAG: carboxypeptidase-like regulatory domain-containing protein, partial [Saprospiraceae bacterium]
MNPSKLKIKLNFSLFLLLLLSGGPLFAQKITSIHGKVIDAQTKDGLSYASIQVPDANLGTRADIDGNFLIEVPLSVKKLRVSYVGYTTLLVDIKPGENNELEVALTDASVNLKEVEVRPDKYRRKNNPAVNLINEVFAHKDQNRKEGLDFYS